MLLALGAVALTLSLCAWSVWTLAAAIDRHGASVEAHGAQLVQFGRAVYGSSGSFQAASQQTIADPDAAARLAGSDEARKSGPE